MLLRIRHAHHTLARLIAEGKKDIEISAITGYSPSRISILKGDPAFADLVAYYTSQVEAIFVDVHERLKTLTVEAIEELATRLEENPESFTSRDLLLVAELAADRSGFGPSAKVTHEHNFVTDEFLEKLRSESRSSVKIIDATPTLPSGQGPPGGGTLDRQAALAEGARPIASPAPGPDLRAPDREEAGTLLPFERKVDPV
jgi:hypothetical protein